jgi:hypothetical protein
MSKDSSTRADQVSISARLDRLEAQLRRWRWCAAALTVSFGLSMLLAFGAANNDVISARAFQLVDADNKVLARWADTRDGGSELFLNSKKGKGAIALTVDPEGLAGLVLTDQKGEAKIVMGTDQKGTVLHFCKGEKKFPVALEMTNDGNAVMGLGDADGKVRLALSVTDGKPYLHVMGQDEKPHISLSLGTGESPSLMLTGKEKKERAVVGIDQKANPFIMLMDEQDHMIFHAP